MISQYTKLLMLLLQDAVLVNFEYWGEFIIRLQRDEAKRLPELREWFGERRIPPLFCLRLRGEWWVGQKEKWEMSVQQFPMKGAPPMPIEAPLQASTLVMLLDIEISPDLELTRMETLFSFFLMGKSSRSGGPKSSGPRAGS